MLLLIIVFILIGSISALVISLSEDDFMFNEYIERTVEYEQIYMMSDLAFEAVKEILKNDNSKVDYYGEFWSQNIIIPIENGKINIQIVDQERFLNPNYLVNLDDTVNQKYFSIFERLFSYLNIDERVLYNIIDWIDKNSQSDGGKEIYPDFVAKNSKIDTLEELLLIEGINDKILYGNSSSSGLNLGLNSVLSPYSNGKVNINTASKWVLMSLDRDIDEALANEIVLYRKRKYFKDIKDLNLVEGVTGDIIHRISGLVDVKSENFLVNIDITFGDREYKMFLLLNRKGKNIRKIWQKVY